MALTLESGQPLEGPTFVRMMRTLDKAQVTINFFCSQLDYLIFASVQVLVSGASGGNGKNTRVHWLGSYWEPSIITNERTHVWLVVAHGNQGEAPLHKPYQLPRECTLITCVCACTYLLLSETNWRQIFITAFSRFSGCLQLLGGRP